MPYTQVEELQPGEFPSTLSQIFMVKIIISHLMMYNFFLNYSIYVNYIRYKKVVLSYFRTFINKNTFQIYNFQFSLHFLNYSIYVNHIGYKKVVLIYFRTFINKNTFQIYTFDFSLSLAYYKNKK